MIKDQAHRVFKVFELRRLNILNLIIVHLALFHEGIQLLCSQVLKLQTESLSYMMMCEKVETEKRCKLGATDKR